MSRPAKILITVVASIAGLIVVLVIAAYIILHTGWFSSFVRGKIASTVEQATGAKAEIGSFQVDWTSLTIHIRNVVVHGTEPASAAPLVHVSAITLHLKLFSGIAHMIDIAYVGVQQPQVDLIVFPDGKTNIPHPKIQKTVTKSSGKSGGNSLQTVVNLKIGKFDIEDGLIQFAQEKTAFNARGENLRAILNYNGSVPNYQGGLSIDPLLLASGGRPPVAARVVIPITIESNAVRVAHAQIWTGQSSLVLNASVENLNAPDIQAGLNASISLPELRRSFNMPIEPDAPGAPKVLTADLAVGINGPTNSIQVKTARIALGNSFFQAAGALNGPNNGAIRFNGNLALAQLTRLMNASTQASGAILVNGAVKRDAQDNYSVDGAVSSRDLAFSNGTTHISDVNLSTPFHADPYLIDLNQLRLHALGGDVTAKLFIERMQQLSFESHLRSFDLPVIAAVATGKHIGYDGVIDGSIKAEGNLKAKGATGLNGEANLTIVPGHRGMPLSGRLVANYAGASGAIDILHSYLALPDTRLDISGALNQTASARQHIDLNLVSHNLNDFLPAMNVASSGQHATTLPVSLRSGGSAVVQAQITGTLKEPQIASRAALTRFNVRRQPFDRLSMNLTASPSGAAIQDGVLQSKISNGNFNASLGLVKWKPVPRSPLSANLTLHDTNIADLMNMAGESSLNASGVLSAGAHIHGTYGVPLGAVMLSIDKGNFDGQPFDRLYANVNLADQLISLTPLELAIGAARVDVTGSLQHPRDSFTTGHAQFQVKTENLQLANLEAVRSQKRGIAGSVQLNAVAAADIRKPNGKTKVTISNISADLSATGLEVENQSAGNLMASARTVNGAIQYNLTSNLAGSNITLNGKTSLADNYATVADASIQNLSIGKTLELADESWIPARGTLSATAHVAGTVKAPSANLSFALVRADVYQQGINSLRGSVQYSNTAVNIPSIALDMPAGSVTMSGMFSHAANDFNAGSIRVRVNSTPIRLARIQKLAQMQPRIAGTVQLAADLAASFNRRQGVRGVRVSDLNANASASGLRIDNRDVGNATLTARTTGRNLTFALNSNLVQSQIKASGRATLTGDYPVHATLSFANIKYVNVYPFISSGPETQPSFDALVAGQASVNGPILKAADLDGQVQLSTLRVETLPHASPTGAPAPAAVALQNSGPIDIELNHEIVRVRQFHLTGPQTNITATGGVDLRNASSPLRLRLNAGVNLAMLSDVNHQIYSSGTFTLQAAIHGTPTAPAATGTMQLHNANFEYTGSPVGLTNANAVIQLQGTTAEIQSFTGETGGGKLTLAGFASYTGRAITFNVTANTKRSRILYSGVSVVTSADIRLVGNTRHSLVRGTVSIDRIAYGAATDAGSLLSSASGPPSSPSAPSPMMAGMRLDIHVLNSPGLRVVSSYTQSVEIFADLTIRGTAANPGIVGSVRVTNGTLLFFGNKYTVNIGTVNFYNPYEIQPVLNFSLQTIAQGVSVTLGVSGSMDDLKLSYHSDPPLTFEQIVRLLATNTTPSTDPTIAANQPRPPQQSASQMGASALLGQAVANPVASRLQHVFGLSEFKIDPSFQGSNGLPTARITLKQQITSNLMFTYIEDLSQTNAEIIRVEWDFTSRFSAVATRDWNGIVGLQFLYAFKKR